MKTTLPTAITTIDEAKAFLTELHSNNELYHPEDDAHTIDWVTMHDEDKPTPAECDRLNVLMGQIYLLSGNDGRHNSPLAFDPCAFLAHLNYEQSDIWIEQVKAAYEAFTERTENGLLVIEFLIHDLQRIQDGEIVFTNIEEV